MFFVSIMVCFYLVGVMLMLESIMFPGFFMTPVDMYVQFTGLILASVGIFLYISRAAQVGGHHFTDLAKPDNPIIIHLGNSGAKIYRGKKTDLNRIEIRGKHRMNLKDMGDPIYIAGHEVFLSSQTNNYTYPLWVIDLVDKWKIKYGVRNKREWQMLYDQLKNIKNYSDLDEISLLKPVMSDPEKRRFIFDMSLDDIRNMKELLFDGATKNAKAYLDWDESANPYDNESIIKRTLAHRAEQRSTYKVLGGRLDYGAVAIAFFIILVGGAIAFQVFGG